MNSARAILEEEERQLRRTKSRQRRVLLYQGRAYVETNRRLAEVIEALKRIEE